MKKILFVLVLSCLVFSVFALDGIVVDVIGKVEKQYGDSWIALKKGDVLSPGDVVSTGFKSEAVLSIGESTVTVNALTRLTVEQLYEKNKNHVSSVYLDTGSICADIKPVENKRVGFTVKTPAVTALFVVPLVMFTLMEKLRQFVVHGVFLLLFQKKLTSIELKLMEFL